MTTYAGINFQIPHTIVIIIMWPSLGRHIKCCILSPSVCPVPTIYSKSECHWSLKFIGHLTQDTSDWDSHRFHE